VGEGARDWHGRFDRQCAKELRQRVQIAVASVRLLWRAHALVLTMWKSAAPSLRERRLAEQPEKGTSSCRRHGDRGRRSA
jgi:hypothetical protein